MESKKGFEVAQFIQSSQSLIAIVFITSRSEFATLAFTNTQVSALNLG